MRSIAYSPQSILKVLTTRFDQATLILSALCLCLVVIVGLELTVSVGGSVTPPPARAAEHPGPVAGPVTFALPSLGELAEVVRRPLFLSTRQPLPPELTQEALGKSTSFSLVAIIIAADDKVALIHHGIPPAVARVKEGQNVEGWSVDQILSDRVVLRHGAAEHEIKLLDQHP